MLTKNNTKFILILSQRIVFMGPIVDSRMKTPNVKMPHTKFEVKASAHQLGNVMLSF